IASSYIGFAVADGRRAVLAVESGVAGMFVIVAAAGITGTPWLLVGGLAGHGFKDLWQHRRQFVADTRWWPPFCLVVDWVVAAVIAVERGRIERVADDRLGLQATQPFPLPRRPRHPPPPRAQPQPAAAPVAPRSPNSLREQRPALPRIMRER